MKKLIPFLMAAILFSGCKTEKPAETTVLEQFTPYFLFPETLKGKVKELVEVNFWVVEQDGKIVAGNHITIKDRDSLINWTNDFRVHFDESGAITLMEYLDEDGKTTGKIETTSEGGKYISAKWYSNDTLRTYGKFYYDSTRLVRSERFLAENDSLIGVMNIEYGDLGRSVIQLFDSKGQPRTKYDYTLNESGLIAGYTWSFNDTVRGGMNFIYNDLGITSEQEVYNKTTGTSETYKYECEYDPTGNWIKYVASKEGTPEVVCTRTIVYYEQ